jgi:hypothetical protein
MAKCYLCLNTDAIEQKANVDAYDISCPICGNYRIIGSAVGADLRVEGKRYLVSAAVRQRSDQGERILISENSVKRILESISVPSNPFESIDLLLWHFFRKSEQVGGVVPLDIKTDYPIVFAKTPEEFRYYIKKAANELNYIEPGGQGRSGFCLSLNGWRRLDELRRCERKSNRAFVAMWFNPSLDNAWEKGFKSALEKTGYDPVRIDLAEHNEKICDRIIAEIRKSGLVVADFTGQRGGVYYEAGYAMGLGIPVIWTCKDTDVKELHFDTRQYNHIVWSNPEELRKKLINRVEATIPLRVRKKT